MDSANLQELQQSHDKFSGEIIRHARGVEELLELVIAKQCMYRKYEARIVCKENAHKLNFKGKVKGFEEICVAENLLTQNELKEIISSLQYIREIRNKIAHSERYLVGGRISIRFPQLAPLIIDESLVNKIKEQRLKVLPALVKIIQKFQELSQSI